jgi:hypothetical protein
MQNASGGLQALNPAEMNAVSGGASELIDMGIFGRLVIRGNGCVTWSDTEFNGDGSLTTNITQCPK